MEQIRLDLSGLEIHRLDIDPQAERDAIEFQLHGTLTDLDETEIQKVTDNALVPEEITLSIESQGG